VDRSLPTLATGFVNAKAGVFAPALVEEIDMPVRTRSPYQSRKRIDDASELALHSAAFVTYAAAQICASLSANVHDTLVSVCGLRRSGGEFEKITACR
jgi:hypothetical protein